MLAVRKGNWKFIPNGGKKKLGPELFDLAADPAETKNLAADKVLKSGCRAEQSKLRTAERLTNLLAVLCVVGWRVFWLTMVNRIAPAAPPDVAFTPAEIAVLDRISGDTPPAPQRTVSHYLLEVAKLGGYLARTKDPPPGNMVLWRGLTRLTDLCLGFELNNQVVGN